MDISVKQSDQISIVSIAGSIDALTADQIVDCIDERISSGEKHLVLGLSEVEFMSSAGLRVILDAMKKTRQQGGDLYLAGAHGGVDKVLKMSGFSNILKTYDSVANALARLNV
ncbi:MAG: STAS domain-containing protein [bacterium]|nr:STAS domain-containing protein [bacterium]